MKLIISIIFMSILFVSCDSSKTIRIAVGSDEDRSDSEDTDLTDDDSSDTGNTGGDTGDTGGDTGDTGGDTGDTGGDTGDTGGDTGDTGGDTGDTGGDTGDTGGDTGNTGDTGSPDCETNDDCAYLNDKCVEGICNSDDVCEAVNKPETTLCNDGVFCNGEDACNDNGQCISGSDYPCGDTLCREESGGMCCEGGFAGPNCSKCVRFVYESGIKTPDGLTWNTAFSTVQEAVDSANDAILIESNGIDSCEIWIAQGKYEVPATIKIYSDISIIGGFEALGEKRVNDPSVTVLDGSANKMDNIIDASGASNVTLMSLTFYGNTNQGTDDNYAGALYISNAAGFVVNSVIFDTNRAVGESADNGYEGRGGAVAVIESDAVFSDCEFKNNNAQNGERPGGLNTNASSYGGAVFVYLGNVTFSNSTFSSNTVTKRENGTASGGAIFAYNPASLTITGCTFEGNTTQNWGGAVRVEQGNVTFSENVFTANSANENGGAVEFNNVESASFIKNTFSKNIASTGGAVHLSNNSRNITISESTFSENEATTLAAGISVSTSKNSIVITRSKFILNNCKGGTECRGGAIGIDNNASATIVNSLITKNNAKNYGGGLYVRNDSSANLVFSTLADNTTASGCTNTGSGIHNYDSAVTNIYSSVVHGNGPCNQTQNNTNSSTNVVYSLFQGGYSGTGNINDDPSFVDRANGDYHLNTGSPCIDTAGNESENPAIDLDGATRPSGSGYDMGCYEK